MDFKLPALTDHLGWARHNGIANGAATAVSHVRNKTTRPIEDAKLKEVIGDIAREAWRDYNEVGDGTTVAPAPIEAEWCTIYAEKYEQEYKRVTALLYIKVEVGDEKGILGTIETSLAGFQCKGPEQGFLERMLKTWRREFPEAQTYVELLRTLIQHARPPRWVREVTE